MHRVTLERIAARSLAVGVMAIIVLIPFHAFLTVWLSHMVGHYTLLRLWKELLLIPLALSACYLLATQQQLRRTFVNSPLLGLIAAYLGVQVVWGVIASRMHQVAPMALGYGLVSNTRFLFFFFMCWVAGSSWPQLHGWWRRLVFWPAVIVVAVGLLQYAVLPHTFLEHFGYGPTTIFPYEDINNNIHHIRVMSTLRGANPLGAYLVVVLCLFAAGVAYGEKALNRLAGKVMFGIGSFVVLGLTFSRGAWLGLVAGWGALAALRGNVRLSQRWLAALAAICLVLVGSAVVFLRHSIVLQDILLHTDTQSAVQTTSNSGHLSALQGSVRDMLHEPLGRGPGTAGPASVYNTGHDVRIAENYFLQVVQETGWLGLGLFVAITAVIGLQLYWRRTDALAVGLLSALTGVIIVNLLSHAWADDTLAYLWWGLAGIAVASTAASERLHH